MNVKASMFAYYTHYKKIKIYKLLDTCLKDILQQSTKLIEKKTNLISIQSKLNQEVFDLLNCDLLLKQLKTFVQNDLL
jgi:hypothetical protein